MKINFKTLIIAEIGVNHNGSLKLAKKLILGAKRSGADFVKFQLFNVNSLVTQFSPAADYQKKNTKIKNQIQILKKLYLNFEKMLKLKKYSKKVGINFLVSVFDEVSLKDFKKLKIKRIKIPSGEINNYLLLKKIAKLNLETILSTGASNEREVKNTLSFLTKNGLKKNKISILHCNSEYPSPLKDINLNVIKRFKKIFLNKIGFSDHSSNLNAGALAVVAGARILEKHITLGNALNGPDHRASLNIKDFKKYCENVREAEIMLGDHKKRITKSEIKNRKLIRKVIVAKLEINKGDIFTFNNISTKRSKKGIDANLFFKILSKKSNYNFKVDESIRI